MNFEHIGNIEEVEDIKKFEDLGFTRNFDAVSTFDVKRIVKENSDYWRIPAVAEFLALRKQNKRNFFTQKSYWAEDSIDRDKAHELRGVRITFLGEPAVYYAGENPTRKKYLVLFKKGTVITGTDEEVGHMENGIPF